LIHPPVKDERLSRPEPMQVNNLPRVAKKVQAVPGFNWLSWPSASLPKCSYVATSCVHVVHTVVCLWHNIIPSNSPFKNRKGNGRLWMSCGPPFTTQAVSWGHCQLS